MSLQHRVASISFLLLALTGMNGCALLKAVGGGGLERAEGRLYVGPMGDFGGAVGYLFTLNEPRFVRRIVLHSAAPVKNVDVYVRVGKDEWKVAAQLKKPVDSRTPIEINIRGDVVRVVQKSITWGSGDRFRARTGKNVIRDIEVFVAQK